MQTTVRIVRNPDDTWPPELVDKNPGAWVEMSEKNWWHFLEVLPPHYFSGGFAVSEPAHYNEHNEAVYLCCVKIGSRFYCRELPLWIAPLETRALRDSIGV